MEDRSQKIRSRKIQQKMLVRRKETWPNLDTDHLWIRTEKKGFATLPRTMPLILRIMDSLAGKGRPVSSTYLSLWCRVFDECFITINNPQDMAYEAGFSGQRSESSWSSRMKILHDLGFIDAQGELSEKYKYVLLFNPYYIIYSHYKEGEVSKEDYMRLYRRAQDIGAEDLSDTAVLEEFCLAQQKRNALKVAS